jgi:hypothetical protein
MVRRLRSPSVNRQQCDGHCKDQHRDPSRRPAVVAFIVFRHGRPPPGKSAGVPPKARAFNFLPALRAGAADVRGQIVSARCAKALRPSLGREASSALLSVLHRAHDDKKQGHEEENGAGPSAAWLANRVGERGHKYAEDHQNSRGFYNLKQDETPT